MRAAVEALHQAGDIHAWIGAGDQQRWGREKFVSLGSEHDLATGRAVRAALIRPVYRCNQRCAFCWIDLHQQTVPHAAMVQTLAAAALQGLEVLAFTGGEPTLDPRLPLYVELARALGARQVTLQTNAVLLDDPERVAGLAAAGLTRAFVALHGADAAVSEAITGAPGTFARTVRGVQNLLAAHVSVGIGIVFTHANREQGRQLVEFIAETMPGVDVTFSVAQPVNELVPIREAIPRYSELAATLRGAAQTAHDRGLPYVGLLGQCGLPPCVLDAESICFPELQRDHPDWSSPEDFAHVEVCARCRLRRGCPGIRRRYLEAFGDAEFHPV